MWKRHVRGISRASTHMRPPPNGDVVRQGKGNMISWYNANKRQRTSLSIVNHHCDDVLDPNSRLVWDRGLLLRHTKFRTHESAGDMAEVSMQFLRTGGPTAGYVPVILEYFPETRTVQMLFDVVTGPNTPPGQLGVAYCTEAGLDNGEHWRMNVGSARVNISVNQETTVFVVQPGKRVVYTF